MGNTMSSAISSRSVATTAIVTSVMLTSGCAGLAWLFYLRVSRATQLDHVGAQCHNLEQLNAAIDALRYCLVYFLIKDFIKHHLTFQQRGN